MMLETTKEPRMDDLFSVREVEDRYEVLTTIGGNVWNEKTGKYERDETWEPLAGLIVRTRMLEAPNGEVFPVSLGDALRREGWLTPQEAEGLQRACPEFGEEDTN